MLPPHQHRTLKDDFTMVVKPTTMTMASVATATATAVSSSSPLLNLSNTKNMDIININKHTTHKILS